MSRDSIQNFQSDELRSYLAAIIETSDDAIIGKNLDGTITFWNAAAERIFGHTAEEAVGKHITLIIPKEREDEEFIIIGKVKNGQRVDHFETVRMRKNGERFDISVTVSPIRNAKGEIIGASKVARDISTQKRTEQELLESNQRKDDFLAGISHELRTPMNAIIGLANIIATTVTLTGKERQYVDTLKTSAEGLMALINNLLDFSKLGSDQIELEEIEFNLPELVDRLLNMMSIKAKEKNLSLTVSYGAGLRKYYFGDPFRLQQILTNLLANAIKFTNKGSVELRVSQKEIRADQSTLMFDVVDTGIGIPHDKMDMIFDKFTQVDSSTTRKYGGSGLGLSICKALVEKMGGRIWVESKEGLGTTFSVELTLKTNNVALADVTSELSRVHKHVLVVDDYAPNILVVTAILEGAGYSYDTAINGMEALRRVQSRSYDVILMDVQMHDMDGFESTRHIRTFENENGFVKTPIIAMTAHVQERDKSKCMEVGMTDFLGKPFNTDDLVNKIKAIIPQAGHEKS